MDLFRDFETDIRHVIGLCSSAISDYPPPLRSIGLNYLRQIKLRGSRTLPKGITIPFPFWLNDIFGLSADVCRDISLVSAYTLLYFLAQDELADEPSSDMHRAELTALSTLFFSGLNRQCRSRFNSGSPFWCHWERYLCEWAQAVVWERRLHWNRLHQYSRSDLLLVGRKAAPLKLAGAAMSILAGKQELIQPLDTMMDHAQVSFQMLDDLRDWRGDLERRDYTYFLARSARRLGARPSAEAVEADVIETGIFIGDAVDDVIDVTLRHNNLALEPINGLNAPYLKAFIMGQTHVCDLIKRRLQSERKRLLKKAVSELLSTANSRKISREVICRPKKDSMRGDRCHGNYETTRQ